MKQSFKILNSEIAEAAIKDAANFGLVATLENKDNETIISYESKADMMAPNEGDKEESDCCCKDCCKMCDVSAMISSVYSEMNYQLKWLREDMRYYNQQFISHMEGHLPAIKDAGKMQAAINTLGMGDSYEVKKAAVYVQY